MAKYKIRSVSTKIIEADSEEEAHNMFSMFCSSSNSEDETYDQETVEVIEDGTPSK